MMGLAPFTSIGYLEKETPDYFLRPVSSILSSAGARLIDAVSVSVSLEY